MTGLAARPAPTTVLPTLDTRPLAVTFGAEIRGVDLSGPIDPGTARALQAAFTRHRLLLLRDQKLDPEHQAAFARLFGTIETRDDGIPGTGELDFHCAQLFMPDPVKALMLYGIQIPAEGDDTHFVDAEAALDRMPIDLRARARLMKCLHAYDFKADDTKRLDHAADRGDTKTAIHPMLYADDDGRESLWVNPLTTQRVEEVAPEESKFLIAETRRYLYGDERIVYRHRWRLGDILVWNNWLLQHARTPFDAGQPRTLRRTSII